MDESAVWVKKIEIRNGPQQGANAVFRGRCFYIACQSCLYDAHRGSSLRDFCGYRRYDKRRKRAPYEKTPVVGLVERKGQVQAYKIPTASKQILVGVVKDRIAPDATAYADELRAYKSIPHKHDTVNHIALEYVRGDVHTNTIENFWSLLKRGVIGSYHQVSIKHLERYLPEFTYRFNRRDHQEQLFAQTTKNFLNGKNLTYDALTSSPVSES